MTHTAFLEITVHNHMILRGFDDNQKEIIEEVKIRKPVKKILSIKEFYQLVRSMSLQTMHMEGSYIGNMKNPIKN